MSWRSEESDLPDMLVRHALHTAATPVTASAQPTAGYGRTNRLTYPGRLPAGLISHYGLFRFAGLCCFRFLAGSGSCWRCARTGPGSWPRRWPEAADEPAAAATGDCQRAEARSSTPRVRIYSLPSAPMALRVDAGELPCLSRVWHGWVTLAMPASFPDRH
jgi:hypothetical protein